MKRKIGTTLAVCAALLAGAGCATTEIPEGACRRGGYFVPGEKDATPAYAAALHEMFDFDNPNPTTASVLVYERLDFLERYCWARRVR